MPLYNISGAKVATCLTPFLAHTTAEATGTGVAVGGYADVTMIWAQGVSLDTLGGTLYWTITFEECDDNSTWTLIAAADIEAATATVTIDASAEDPTLLVRRYRGTKAYVRMLGTKTGTHTNGTPVAALVHLGGAIHTPQTKETELGTAA